jgi:hypothetical protein
MAVNITLNIPEEKQYLYDVIPGYPRDLSIDYYRLDKLACSIRHADFWKNKTGFHGDNKYDNYPTVINKIIETNADQIVTDCIPVVQRNNKKYSKYYDILLYILYFELNISAENKEKAIWSILNSDNIENSSSAIHPLMVIMRQKSYKLSKEMIYDVYDKITDNYEYFKYDSLFKLVGIPPHDIRWLFLCCQEVPLSLKHEILWKHYKKNELKDIVQNLTYLTDERVFKLGKDKGFHLNYKSIDTPLFQGIIKSDRGLRIENKVIKELTFERYAKEQNKETALRRIK